MRLPVRLHAPALEELHAAAAWYEAQSPGLGARFLDATQAAFDLIATFPDAGPGVEEVPGTLGARRVRVLGFPYSVVYRVLRRGVRVFAIAHSSREPRYWRRRR